MRIKHIDKRTWHRWFAWFPVWLVETNETIWLEFIERRFHPDIDDWEYRDIPSIS